jgi:hypothetical protein
MRMEEMQRCHKAMKHHTENCWLVQLLKPRIICRAAKVSTRRASILSRIQQSIQVESSAAEVHLSREWHIQLNLPEVKEIWLVASEYRMV